MSRSGYTDDYGDDENGVGTLNLFRANVVRSLGSKRGQAFLREMADALDAMPDKQLIPSALVCEDGCCAMGAVALARKLDTSRVDAEEPDQVAKALGIAEIMAREIAYENDECGGWSWPSAGEMPSARWTRMRKWVAENLKPAEAVKDGR